MDVNTYFIRTALWPAIVCTIVFMVIGCLGNGLIIFIYRHHFYRSVPWLFIYMLAIVDILACLIAMPSELVILVSFSSFPSAAFCKLSRYLSFTLHGSSCVILMAIALNRYEKVCRPNNQKLTMKRSKRFCIATILFACVSYLPCFFIYGELRIPLQIHDDGVTFLPADFNVTAMETMSSTSNKIIIGKFCSITNDSNQLLAMAFYLFQFILYATLVILVIFFYSRVISKMVSYSNKQQLLLAQMTAGANRADHIRKASADNRMLVVHDEQTADFSKDFCRNEISADFDREEKRGDYAHQKNNLASLKEEHDNIKQQISPPIVDEENEKHIMKPTGSESNIRFVSTKSSSDPIETNQLLMRRIHSTDNFNNLSVRIPQLQIIPSLDPYEAMFEPLFLHAPKTHKKKSSTVRGSKKAKNKMVSRSKSNVDVSMRMVKPPNRENDQKVVSCRSLEALATLHCVNTITDGTLTVTRRTPKGSKNCVIPLTGLSMKSAVSYDPLDPTEREPEDSDRLNTTDDILDDKSNNNSNDQTMEEELQQTDASIPTKKTVGIKISGIRFNVSEDQDADDKTVQMRSPRGSSSGRRSNTSDKILTPTPAPRKLDYQRRQSVRPIRAHRTSRMLFWISLAFVLSFLPFWVIVFVRTIIGSNFNSSLTMTELGVISVFIRFTLISNAINPLIYGLMNTQFRNRCSAIFKASTRR